MFWSSLRGDNQPPDAFVEVVETRLRAVLHVFASQIRVDEEYYLRQNPDVAEKIGIGEISSAKDHYISSGYFEDRFPRAIPVDEPWYLAQYADVRDAVSNGIFFSARQHFEKEGFREGRLPSPDWSLVERRLL